MKTAELKVEERSIGCKSTNRRLRREGRVPAIIYGPESENTGCSFEERDLKKVFRGHISLNTIITFQSESKALSGKRVILKSLERDPVRWTLDHVDFYEISDKRPIQIKVPLEFKGVPVGVKIGGGIFQVIRRELSLLALPTSIPEKVEIDVSGLELNKSIHVADISVGAGIQIVDSKTYTICAVNEPEKEEAATPVAAAATPEAAAPAAAAAPAKAEAAPAKK
jgi:large subunit ribosomal protein L25